MAAAVQSEAKPKKPEKFRPGLSLTRDPYWNYVVSRAQRTGKNNGEVVEEAIQLLMDADTSNPVEVDRKRVIAKLVDVSGHLKKLQYDKKYSRSRTIAGFLVHNPKNDREGSTFPAGPYLNLNEDWDQIRIQAVADFENNATWVRVLKKLIGIEIESAVEIDQACDVASEIKKLKQSKKELETRNKVLRVQMVNPRSAAVIQELQTESSGVQAQDGGKTTPVS